MYLTPTDWTTLRPRTVASLVQVMARINVSFEDRFPPPEILGEEIEEAFASRELGDDFPKTWGDAVMMFGRCAA